MIHSVHVGRPLSQIMDPVHADQPGLMPVITPASSCVGTGPLIRSFMSTPNTAQAWASANDPVAVPFWVQSPVTVYQLGWQNGSAAGGNLDLGIYDSAWVRKISTGSTAGGTNSVWQFVDVADTVLVPGKYYMVLVLDNVTANRIALWPLNSTPALALVGVQDSATDAFPLPDPLTNMAQVAVALHVPAMAVVLRSVV